MNVCELLCALLHVSFAAISVMFFFVVCMCAFLRLCVCEGVWRERVGLLWSAGMNCDCVSWDDVGAEECVGWVCPS